MDKLKSLSASIEGRMEEIATPLKPWIPAIGRFLLVITFIEDAFRILAQWPDQLAYIQNFRGFPYGISHAFLVVNVLLEFSGSFLVLARKYVSYAVGGLFAVILLQAVGYGMLLEDAGFVLRSVSLSGGLLLLWAESIPKQRDLFGVLPSVEKFDRSAYLQLFGRILLIFLFFSILIGEMSFLRILFSIVGFIICMMVVVGFKAKWSAMFLVSILSVSNMIVNSWWSLHHSHPLRDYRKYDFFQTLSVMGGYLLLMSMGPGGVSVDEKKKMY